MPYELGQPCDYIRLKSETRIQRANKHFDIDGRPWSPGVAYGVSMTGDMRQQYPQPYDWTPVLNRLDASGLYYFSWSAFTDQWRRYFALADQADGRRFERIMLDMGAVRK